MAQLSARAIRNLLPFMSGEINMTDKAKTKIRWLINLNNTEEEVAKSRG